MRHVLNAFSARSFVLAIALSFSASAAAASIPSFSVVIKNQQYQPSEISVPAGQKFKLIVKNEDTTPAEFESYDLNREKVIPAQGKVTVYVGPLDSGSYNFFNDFHPSATGKLIAK